MWIDRRWLVPGVAISVLLNVFLIGIIAGHLYAGRSPRPAGIAVIEEAHVRALPTDERTKFMAAMATQRSAIASARKAHQAARGALQADIAAPVFDRAQVTTAFAAFRHAGTALQEVSNAALVEALAALSPASRAALVAHAAGKEGPERR